jgi:2-oxoglutarate dehydrogenase E1 component
MFICTAFYSNVSFICNLSIDSGAKKFLMIWAETMSFNYASLGNLQLIEQLYEAYKQNPEAVDPSWRAFFEGVQFASTRVPGGEKVSGDLRVDHLIQAYRIYGHLAASISPIQPTEKKEPAELKLRQFGLTANDLEKVMPTCGFLPQKEAPLKTTLAALKQTYASTVGFEYMGLEKPEIEKWIQSKIEPGFPLNLSREEKLGILKLLNRSELFETFLHMKYVGKKRFSLEGGESFIPLLDALLEKGSELGLTNTVIGMAHRGRLNVMANTLGKSYQQIFSEFEDFASLESFEIAGDVKYHKGIEGSLKTAKGKSIGILLAPNPSHLESVDPVVEGCVRALQEQMGSGKGTREIVPILIHGDAALSGQGVVYETMQLLGLNGYSTGGTIHIVLNNQIGFTTSPKEGRSTRYCTDIAKGFGSPIFHVNAEDPERCVAVAKLAIELRQTYGCDVFIDFVCYRKYGHNEGDEPMFTQPLDYLTIKSKKTIRDLYIAQLVNEGVLDSSAAEKMESDFKNELQEALKTVQSTPPQENGKRKQSSESYTAATAVAQDKLVTLAESFCTPPPNFQLHPKIQKLLHDRLNMIHADPKTALIDWGLAENLAYASLVVQGVPVRLSGQDCRRGTFSHRHAMWVDQANGRQYFPLSHLSNSQAACDIFNSPLSEFAVLAFEFGYSATHLNSLVLWEAQYGDFYNGAQIVVDQYIASSEQKWGQQSAVTLLLPHAFEGAGPEHSSARIERFLQLCADDNMVIANCTTPAQLFHILRRQALKTRKNPLVLFTPKMLLRYNECVSSLSDLSTGSFQEVIDDPNPSEAPRKLIFCCGKVYYELLAEKKNRKANDLAIVRIEQLHPFPRARVEEMVKKYGSAQQIVWLQEEHSNAGAWNYIRPLLSEILGEKRPLQYVGRAASSSTAAGSHALHKKQQSAFMEELFR